MNRGIFAVDPGGSTGTAWAVLDPKASTGEALQNRLMAGSQTFEGRWEDQVRDICELWRDFYGACVRQGRLPADHVEFVCEDFVLRPGSHPGGTEGTLPLRLIGGMVGYRLGALAEWERNGNGPAALPPIIFQQPNQASTFATNPRLKDWGVWVRGREHERSAWRHVALRHATIKNQLETK